MTPGPYMNTYSPGDVTDNPITPLMAWFCKGISAPLPSISSSHTTVTAVSISALIEVRTAINSGIATRYGLDGPGIEAR